MRGGARAEKGKGMEHTINSRKEETPLLWWGGFCCWGNKGLKGSNKRVESTDLAGDNGAIITISKRKHLGKGWRVSREMGGRILLE